MTQKHVIIIKSLFWLKSNRPPWPANQKVTLDPVLILCSLANRKKNRPDADVPQFAWPLQSLHKDQVVEPVTTIEIVITTLGAL